MRFPSREVRSIAVTAFTFGWFVPFDGYYKVVALVITAIFLILIKGAWIQNQSSYKKQSTSSI